MFKKPNFFIIGAGKSGTTAIAQYLAEHPRVCFSRPKEPFYFNTDYQLQIVKTQEQYEACFAHAKDADTALVEGTTLYLASTVAVQKILDYQPEAKFVVMLRSPIESVYAGHAQLVYVGVENIQSFEEAWRLQEKRQQGKHIPFMCADPYQLQYGRTFSNGQHLQRLLSLVPRDRVHIIFYDDFVKNNRKTYLELLSFFGLEDDGRVDFPVINESKQSKSRLIALFLWGVLKFKTTYNFSFNTGVTGWLDKLRTKTQKRTPLSKDFREELMEYFLEDTRLLSTLTGKNLDHWVKIKDADSTTKCTGHPQSRGEV